MRFAKRFRFLLLALALAALISACAPKGPGAPLRIYFIDIGQGDATLIEDPLGGAAIVDAGPAQQGVVGKLRALGVTHLDLAIGTHPDADHIGAMDEVMKAFPPIVYLDPHIPHPTGQFISLLTTLQELMESGKTKYLNPGRRTISLGRTLVEIYPTPDPPFDDTNNNSVVAKVVDDDFSALLTGDQEHNEEGWLMSKIPPSEFKSDILKAGHHGSRTGTGDAWLDAVQPAAAIISCGRHNSYGFPHKEVLDKLEKRGIMIFRTDISGTLELRSWGKGFEIRADGRTLYRSHDFRDHRP
ncbi:MAG: ComEC/Rec2 family competence protein [bacterium]